MSARESIQNELTIQHANFLYFWFYYYGDKGLNLIKGDVRSIEGDKVELIDPHITSNVLYFRFLVLQRPFIRVDGKRYFQEETGDKSKLTEHKNRSGRYFTQGELLTPEVFCQRFPKTPLTDTQKKEELLFVHVIDLGKLWQRIIVERFRNDRDALFV